MLTSEGYRDQGREGTRNAVSAIGRAGHGNNLDLGARPPIRARHALRSAIGLFAAIIGGILVFHEPIGSGPVEIGARFLAFCLVIAGAALMPAPMRAAPGAASATG